MSTGNETFDPYAQWLGLNLREQPLDHYLLLGLERYEADPARIEQRADERMRLVRSFQTGPRGRYTQKLMNELAAAKLCLLSPAAKQAYDEQLALWSQETLAGRAADGDVGPASLEPVTVSSESPVAAVLPPPIGAPEPPPVARNDEEAEIEEEAVIEDEAGGTSMPLVAAGLIVGLIGLAIAGWTLGSWGIPAGGAGGGPPSGSAAALAPSQSTANVNKANESEGERSENSSADEPTSPGAEFAGAIEVLQEGSGDVVLSPATAAVGGHTALELEGTEDVLTGWSSPEDFAAWRFRLVRPGFFEVQVTYAAAGEAFGRELELALDGKTKTLELQATSDGYRTDVLTIAVPQTGPHTLRLSQTSVFDGGLRLKLIRLKAVGTGDE